MDFVNGSSKIRAVPANGWCTLADMVKNGKEKNERAAIRRRAGSIMLREAATRSARTMVEPRRFGSTRRQVSVIGQGTWYLDEGDRARVQVDSSPPLVAEVTLGSISRLGLVEGADVWASFKAVEVELLPP